MGAIEKVLAELESLGDKAIQKRILGVEDDTEESKSGESEMPMDAAAPAAEESGEEMSPELLEKLKALLSK